MGPGTTRARAKLIAQQETSMSLATGQFETMKAAGATKKIWHHRDNQDNPRDGTHGKVNHVKLEGETVGIDEKFSNGLRYPRDPEDGRPEEVIRCRCYLTYEFEGAPGSRLETENSLPDTSTQEEIPVTATDNGVTADSGRAADNSAAADSMGTFLRPDGSFDLDAAKADYQKFLQTAPEKNRMYLRQAMEAVEYKQTSNPAVVFAYHPQKDVLTYNPTDPSFGDYAFRVVFTHELGHRIDRFFVRSWEQKEFTDAIQGARAAFDADPERFVQFCKEYDKNGLLSDILSAICEDTVRFPFWHDKKYWQTAGNQEREVFSNLFALETIQDVKKIDFLRKNFTSLLAAYENLTFEL